MLSAGSVGGLPCNQLFLACFFATSYLSLDGCAVGSVEMTDNDELRTRRRAVECLICGTEEIDLSLTDGRSLHRGCAAVLSELVEVGEALLHMRTQLREAKQERESFFGTVSALLGSSRLDEKVTGLRSELTRLEVQERELRDEFEGTRAFVDPEAVLEDIYDFWPDYPPDWEDRKAELRLLKNGRCETCRTADYLQAHHKVPFWQGGSNKLDNLELLCIDCHGKEHGKDFRRDGFDEHQSKLTDKEEFIASAIREGRKISFMYKKWDDDAGRPAKRGQRRTIMPERFVDVESSRRTGFTRCVEGHCELRNAKRRFATHRMYKVTSD